MAKHISELRERLDAPELTEELGDRPVAEIVAELCRDLGVAEAVDSHQWKRRTPADVAVLWARAAGPGVAVRPVADAVKLAGRVVFWPCPERPE